MAIIGCKCMTCGKFIEGFGMEAPFPICKECLGALGEIITKHKTEPHIVGKHADVIIIDEAQTDCAWKKGE